MKGLVLAGGTGSRLYPLTKVTNKHLLPVGRYPMVFHPIAKLAEAGIVDILVVCGLEHMGDIVRVLGSGRDLGLRFTYRVQDSAGGIAEAIGLADGFVGPADTYVVVLGDNIFQDSIGPYVEKFKRQNGGARILLKEVPDPQRYGVAILDRDQLLGIDEKPAHPKSRLAVTGIYMYDYHSLEVIRTLRPSARGELEITDVNNAYIKAGTMQYDLLPGWWTDAGTLDSLTLANRLTAALELPIFRQHDETKGAHLASPRKGHTPSGTST